MSKAEEYLLSIGFDDSHLPELFNDDDKSYYKIFELLESYLQHRVEAISDEDISEALCIGLDMEIEYVEYLKAFEYRKDGVNWFKQQLLNK